MKTALILLTGLAIILVSLWFFGPRTIKTAWLITQVSPYERHLENAPTILVLGDSTGYGTGATEARHSIAGRIGHDYPQYNTKNNSVNGRTIGGLQTVASEVTGQHELILLQIGGNDIIQKRDVDTVETELRKVISDLKNNSDSIVMMSSGNVGGASAFSAEQSKLYEAITREFRDMFINVSKDTDIEYVDLFLEPEDDPFVQQPAVYLSLDGLHPSNAGYDHWYEQLKPTINKVLE